jgi:potassium-transporting ATPase potassium-binding subunit
VNFPNLLQYLVFMLVVIACVRPVGTYLFRVFTGETTLLDPVLRPIERLVYYAAAIDPQSEMDWKEYTLAFIFFNLFGTVLLFVILLVQGRLPWFYPAYQTTPMTLDLALNTAISFSTTTTWQACIGESTMSYLSPCSQSRSNC